MKHGSLNPIGIESLPVIASVAKQSSSTVGLDCFALLAMTAALAGCSVSEPSDAPLSCTSSPNLNGKGKDLASPESRQPQAIVGMDLAKRVREQAGSIWFGTGALSATLSRVPGTEAFALAIDVRQLRTLVADQQAIELALRMDGKSPLPWKANWACQKLADSVASLDTGQSDEQFLDNVSEVEAYFLRLYKANSGHGGDDARIDQ